MKLNYKQMIEQDILTYQSKFLDNVYINVIFKENIHYPTIKKLFDIYGVGFLEPNSQIIMIDGEVFVNNGNVDVNDLRLVEAHEVAHILFGHESVERSDKDELEADLGAYILLKQNGFSTDRVVEMFKDRHGVDFNEGLLTQVNFFNNYLQGQTESH
jgi:hypothetical protein